MRPAVGTPWVNVSALPVVAKSGHGKRPLRNRVDLVVGAAMSGDRISEPPASEVASPSEETVTSMREPLPTKAGSSAVTMTAAMFLVRMLELRTLMPIRSSIDCSDCCGERRVAQAVAGAVETDHEAIADQLVGAHALN